MAQQHGRRRTGSGGKASMGKKGSSIGSSRPAGKPAGSRPASGSGRPASGSSGQRNSTGTRAGFPISGLGSSAALSGILSLLKKNKTARIIAIVLVILLVLYMIKGGTCGGNMCAGGGSNLGITESFGTGIIASTETSGSHSADYNVSSLAREKYVSYPSRNATMTIMVYMCGTDLESQYGMATADLQEMASANLSDNINIIVETGGTKKWKTDGISSSKNQRYMVEANGLKPLGDVGKKSMVEHETLTDFIKFCKKNYEADRYALIFWDHGGGSVTGYGYDQLYPNDSMTLDEIDKALKNSGCKFDFIGFDACLMATLETAFVAERYSDYLIASEETEPGIGWYYTSWLNALSADTSMPTVEIGKNIIDSFVEKCASQTPGNKATLSIIDLAEFSGTVPDAFNDFAESTSELISDNNYEKISDARSEAREFSSNIHQVDFVDLLNRINTSESRDLAEALSGCVKYNRTSTNINNANGISIFFPHGKSSQMSSALKTYDKIGLDGAYGRCIKEFASVSAAGQIANGGGSSIFDSFLGGSSSSSSSMGGFGDLLGSLGGSSSSSSSTGSLGSLIGSLGGSSSGSNSDMLGTMFDLFLGSKKSLEKTGLDVGQDEDWFDEDKVSEYQDYVSENYLDPDHIVITRNEDGQNVVRLTEKEWDLVQTIELNVFFDDGEGYIDLGRDNIFDRDEETGDLYVDFDGEWVTLNGQFAPYYLISEEYSDDEKEYVMTGYIPALLNDARVDLIVVFDSSKEEGEVVGYRTVYDDPAAPEAKIMTNFNMGDKIQLICDYYTYDIEFESSHLFGEPIVYNGDFTVVDMEIAEGRMLYSYYLTDIYGNEMWTPQSEYIVNN